MSEPGCLPVVEVRKCHFYLLLIPDDTRPIIPAVITKQNVNSLLVGERHGKRDGWRREGAREEEKRREGSTNRNQNAEFLARMQKH